PAAQEPEEPQAPFPLAQSLAQGPRSTVRRPATKRGWVSMRRTMAMAGLFTAFTLALLAIGPSASAAKHEQVVFSGEAEGSLGEVGFWIWCAVDESGNYDDCNGAMAFDDLHLVRHVEGEVAEIDDDG